MIKFSIIIPVYKVEKYLRQCVDSVLSQTFTDYEVILVDDGSPDSSPMICDEYGQINTRVHIVHKPNGGLSSARNAGLDVAEGEYVLFLDSDDWWDDDNALQKISDQIRSNNPDILIFGMKKYFSLTGKIGDERTPHCDGAVALSQAQAYQKYMEHNIFVACACDKAVKRQLIEKYHLRFVEGQLSEDIEWCARLLQYAPKISTLAESFYVYRQQTSGSITANITRKNVQHVHDVIAKYARNDAPEPLKHYLANQLVLLMSFSHKVKYSDIKDLIEDSRKYWWLTKYDWYPYVKKVSRVRFLGYQGVRYLLGLYHKYKRG